MNIKYLLATALAVPAALALAAPAQAQVAGIATADPTMAVGRTKALQAANQSIRTTYKNNLDQLAAKEGERQKLLLTLDKNGDKQLDQNEQNSIPQATKTQLQNIDNQITSLSTPAVRAQAFAIEMILQRYREAQQSVVNAKKISVILTPESFVYAPEAADVTGAITTELDRIAPSVPITAPANWRPTRETLAVQQQLQQLQQYAMAAAAAQQRQAGAQPAATAPRPAAATPQQTPPSR